MRIAFALISALALTACAAGPSSNTYVHTAVDASFTGWVRFSGEEFQLYGDEDQVRQPFSRPCVSGAASRNRMRQAVQDLAGHKVTITGRTMAWSASLPGNRITHAGSNIRNECGGGFVILADDIRPAN